MHAVQQMQRRKITREEVFQALARRETVYVSEDDESRLVIQGCTAGNRKLKIVVSRHDEEFVITVAGRFEEG